MQNDKRTILIVGMGTSPAVLTETVWALAHQKEPVVPDEIEVITTSSGKETLLSAVMSGVPSVWERLKSALRKEKIATDGKLVFGDTSIHSIPDKEGNALSDLRTGDDNLLAADFMLREIRRHTESTDTTILCSIAGGRKTMSALLFSCMTLLGREDDKVYHVLLPPDFEAGVEPPFFFPERGVTYTSRRSCKKYKAGQVRSELFEVPFVRMRGWYQEKFKMIPPSYRTLISKVQDVAPPAVVYPEIEIDALNGWVKVDGKLVSMSKTCFAMLLFLADGCPANHFHSKLLALHRSDNVKHCSWLKSFKESSRFADQRHTEDVNKIKSELRLKLKSVGFSAVESLVPQRGVPMTFPIGRIKWQNRDWFLGIDGLERRGKICHE